MHLLTAPHGVCYRWDSTLVWGFASADLTIGFSYLFISSAIAIFTISPPMPLTPKAQAIGYLFAAFVFLCGCTHFTSVIEIWNPFYYSHLVLSGSTAAVSFVTACLFLPVVAQGKAFAEDSIRDPLTGLYNRREFNTRLERELLRVAKGDRVGLIFLDIDNFKHWNSVYGYLQGDRVLQLVAQSVQASIRPYDCLGARVGGEELAIIIAQAESEVLARRAEEIRARIEAIAIHHTKTGQRLEGVTVSVGVAIAPLHGDNPSALIAAASDAMRQAKEEGKNRVVVAQ